MVHPLPLMVKRTKPSFLLIEKSGKRVLLLRPVDVRSDGLGSELGLKSEAELEPVNAQPEE
jgi:hypothetical protein